MNFLYLILFLFGGAIAVWWGSKAQCDNTAAYVLGETCHGCSCVPASHRRTCKSQDYDVKAKAEIFEITPSGKTLAGILELTQKCGCPVNIKGILRLQKILVKGLVGIHIHQYGVDPDCGSTGDHYNPYMEAQPQISAIAALHDSANGNVVGHIYFEFIKGCPLQAFGKLDKLHPGQYSFAIHRYGDLSEGCSSIGEVFDPKKQCKLQRWDKLYELLKSLYHFGGELGSPVPVTNAQRTTRQTTTARNSSTAIIRLNKRNSFSFHLEDPDLGLCGVNSILGRGVRVHGIGTTGSTYCGSIVVGA